MIDKLLNMLEKFNVKRAIELLNNNTSDLSGELPGERLYPMETLILPEYQQVTTPLQVKEALKSVKAKPLLNTLDKEQKVWYLYWREEILKGNYIDAELGYVLIFIYELLNYTFNDNAAFNLSMLDRIYTNYHNRHFSLGDFLPRWICDFCYELEEYDLERKWTAKIRYHELSAYESLKQFENKLETVSITFWKQFMRYNRTRFFKENRNLIYKVFKTSIALLAREYQAQGRNLIEAWIPCNEEVGYARQLFTNAVIGREVKTRLETKRLPNLKMREDLSALFRLAKNIARIKVGETSQLNVAEAHFPEGFGYALLELFRDKSQPALFYRTRFVKTHDQAKVGLGSTIPRPPDLLEQDVATIPPLEFDLERIDILDKESKELIELFALRYDDAEEIVEILKISEKDKESEKEKALNNCAVSVGENFEALFAELTRLECDFLLGFEDLTRVRQEGMNYLKTRRVMMGVFITTLNQKSLDCLGDNLIEQEGDVLRFNEEFKQVLQRLAEEEKVRGRKNS